MAVGYPPGTLARRTRLAIGIGMLGSAALAWIAIARMEASMWGMPMSGLHPWSVLDFAMVLTMWIVMMVGMMLPSAIPTAMVYAQIAQRATRDGRTLAPTSVFVAGYLVAWSAFSLAATFAQWALEHAALLSPMWVMTSRTGAGLVLLAAGVYQLSPWKDACLQSCRAPAPFLAAHWRNGRAGALALGVRHGLFCIGCCALLMLLLFVGGVMNLALVAGITLFVLLEKALPFGRLARWGSAAALIGLGVLALLRSA